MFITTTQVRVRYAETDKMQVVYHGNYVEYFEVGRVEAIRTLGITYREMEEAGVIMPVIEWQARFLRPARYDDLLTVRTTLRELPTGHKITFHQEVLNAAGQVLCAGKVLLYFMTAASMQRVDMPLSLRAVLEPFF